MTISIPGMGSLDKLEKPCAIWGTFGAERTLKTSLLLTMPPPVALVLLDPNSVTTVEKEIARLGLRKDVIYNKAPLTGPEIDHVTLNTLAREKKSTDARKSSAAATKIAELTGKVQGVYRDWMNDTVYKLLNAALGHSDIRSVGIDTFTLLHQYILIACHGRAEKIMPEARRTSNAEITDLMSRLKSASKHVILTHQQREIWTEYVENGETKRRGSGRFECDTWNKLNYWTTAFIEHRQLKSVGDAQRMESDFPKIAYAESPGRLKPGMVVAGVTSCSPNPMLNFTRFVNHLAAEGSDEETAIYEEGGKPNEVTFEDIYERTVEVYS